jgi:hypothetical protein
MLLMGNVVLKMILPIKILRRLYLDIQSLESCASMTPYFAFQIIISTSSGYSIANRSDCMTLCKRNH